MRNKLIGLIASAALLGAPAFAAAQSDTGSTDQTTQSSQSSSTSSTSTQDQGQQGQAGQTQQGTSDQTQGSAVGGAGQAGTEVGQNEITGRVVKAERHTIYLEHMGLVIPLHVTSQTQFTDPSVKSPRDLKEGQDVRASFSIKNRTQNVAQSISLAGQGGAGLQEQGTQGGTMGQPYGTQGQQQPSGTENQGTQGTEQQPGTGGSGDQGTMNPSPNSGDQGTQGSTGSSGQSGSSTGGGGT